MRTCSAVFYAYRCSQHIILFHAALAAFCGISHSHPILRDEFVLFPFCFIQLDPRDSDLVSLHIKKWGFRSTARDPAIRLLFARFGVSCLFSFFVLYEQISERGGIVNYNSLAQGSDALRLLYQKVALQMLGEHPLQGAGFQQLSIQSIAYLDEPAYSSGATHNIYLYLAAENGLFCLGAFLCFIAYLFFYRA